MRAARQRRRRRSEPVQTRPRRPAATPAAAEPRVHAQAELPDDIRRDLPKLVIGGSSYSGDAASRMVMINGQVFHEGDRLGPDLVLERIRLKSAVLAFKGWRYEVLF
jgi:general secretion pathway protein B